MAKRSFMRFVEQKLGKFPYFVLTVFFEWVVICLLFIDGFLAFAANEFSRIFDLKIPCLLCTRIDHAIVHRNPDFYYNDSICDSHKRNVSSLAYCHNHKKLSNIKKMCESCLLSFATEKQSDCDTYKSLVGILHKDLDCFIEDEQHQNYSLPVGKKDESLVDKTSSLRCICCGVPLKAKSSYTRGKNMNSFSQAPAPSPRAAFVTLRNDENRNMDLPHVRYTKFASDNDSEIMEDNFGERKPSTQFKEDPKAASVPLLTEPEDEDAMKTPNFVRGNKFFGVPLDSGNNSPRWAIRISRKSPLEKTEFGFERTTEEGDSESILFCLKRQVRLDRKSLMALYMELDEERSASAVAANNAMAMITRLQAEKAAVQMEALQYQRMMEEQAEYDQEALQATHDLLVKRDEDIKLLEAEIEAYREKYGYLKEFEGLRRYGNESDEENREFKARSYLSEYIGSPSMSRRGSIKERNNHFDQVLFSQMKIEAGRVKKLEKNNNLPSEDGVSTLQTSSESVDQVNDKKGKGCKSSLASELSHLSERMKALETDNGLLDQASQKLLKQSEGTKILSEITQNLQKLQNLVTVPLEVEEASKSS